MRNEKKKNKWAKRFLWILGFIIVFVLLIAIFSPGPINQPNYEITQSDQWEKGATFKVKVDSILTEKDALEIAKKIKQDSVKNDKNVTIWFYKGLDFSSGATQTVNFSKGDPIPDYSITSVSNKVMNDAKNLTLDSLSTKEIIAEDLIPNAGAKEVIYKLQDGKYVQTVLFKGGGYAPFVDLEANPNNGPDIFNFRIISGVDEGMTIKIDKHQKYIEYRESDGSLVSRRELLD